MSIIWNENAQATLNEDISDSAVVVPISENEYSLFLISDTADEFMYATLRNSSNYEYVKIDVANSTTSGLSVSRGQDGSSARAWKKGAILYASLPSEMYDSFVQKGYRSYSGDPTSVVTPSYIGEKLYDSADFAWFKSYGVNNTDWDLRYGELGDPWWNVDYNGDVVPWSSRVSFEAFNFAVGGSRTAMGTVNNGPSGWLTSELDGDLWRFRGAWGSPGELAYYQYLAGEWDAIKIQLFESDGVTSLGGVSSLTAEHMESTNYLTQPVYVRPIRTAAYLTNVPIEMVNFEPTPPREQCGLALDISNSTEFKFRLWMKTAFDPTEGGE